ncbi:MAG: hypothetical protein KDI63_11300 [Gammaproteobacteria bacterium]|nr:hypothetical protein [Gammaproteobacteria bacterium]
MNQISTTHLFPPARPASSGRRVDASPPIEKPTGWSGRPPAAVARISRSREETVPSHEPSKDWRFATDTRFPSRVRQAIQAYHSVAEAEERSSVAQILGFDGYA